MGIMHKFLSPNVSLVVAVTFLTQFLPFGNAAFAFPSWQPTSPSLALVSPSFQGKGLTESNGILLARSDGWESLNKAGSETIKTAPSNNQQGGNGLFRQNTDEWKPIRNESLVAKPSTPSQSAKGIIGTMGGVVEDAALGVQVTIGPESLTKSTRITISPVEASPPLLESPAPEDVQIIQGPTFDLSPSGLVFQKPIQVTVSPSPKFREYLKRGAELEVGYWNGKNWQPVLNQRSDDKGTIYFETGHFTAFTVFVIMGAGALFGIGKKLYEWKYRWRYITPDSPKVIRHAKLFVRNLPDPDRLSSTGRTSLNLKSFATRNKKTTGDRWFLGKPRLLVADGETMISQIDANCADVTNYVASVLLAKKNPHFTDFIAVAGSACCDEQGNRGGHAWIEIRIKGKLYVVDTSNVGNISLLPKDIAYRKQALKPGLQWNQSKDSLKQYVGWDGVPDADPMGKDGHGSKGSTGTSTGTGVSGTFVATPLDGGIQLHYSINGFSLSKPEDTKPSFTTSRSFKIVSPPSPGSIVTVSGSSAPVKKMPCNSDYGSFWLQTEVSLTVDGKTKTYSSSKPCTKKTKGMYYVSQPSGKFNLSIKVPNKNGVTASFSIRQTYVNPRFGDRSVVVIGTSEYK